MNRKRIGLLALCGIGAILFEVGPAFGQASGTGVPDATEKQLGALGGVNILAGVRLWTNTWDMSTVERVPVVPNPANPTNVVLQEIVTTAVTSTEYVPIPFLAARAGNWLGSIYYFPRTSYNSRNDRIGTVDRDEYDISLGYSLLPSSEGSLIVSVGYKRAYASKLVPQLENSGTKVEGVLIGLAGAAPITDRLRLYGSAAYGFATQKVEFAALDGSSRYDGTYRVGEVGLTYVVHTGTTGQVLKNVALTAGYRIQSYTTKSVPLFTTTASATPVILATEHRDLNTTTDGFVIGVVATF